MTSQITAGNSNNDNATSSSSSLPAPPPPEWDRILSASQRNDAVEIERLIEEENVSPNHANVVGQSALHIASLWGNVEAVQTLLSHSASANITNRITGATPLHCLIQSSRGLLNRRVECATLLITLGSANVNVKDLYGCTPLDYVEEFLQEDDEEQEILEGEEREGMQELRRLLVMHSADAETVLKLEELLGYITSCNVEAVQKFLDKDKMENIKMNEERDSLSGDGQEMMMTTTMEILESRDTQTGRTPLLHAVEQLLAICCKIEDIVNDHANGNRSGAGVGKLSETSLQEVQQGSHLVEIIQLLLEAGASPNDVPRRHRNMSIRRRGGHWSNECEANWERNDDNDEDASTVTALHRVCTSLSSAYMSSRRSKTLAHDTTEKIRTKDDTKDGLSLCPSYLQPEQTRITLLEQTAQLLYEYGSSVQQPTILLLHDGARRNNISMVKFLIECLGISPNARGRQGMTPLHFAARSGQVDVVRYLLSCGIGTEDEKKGEGDSTSTKKKKKKVVVEKLDITLVDDRGKTALDAAVVNERHDIVALLENAACA